MGHRKSDQNRKYKKERKSAERMMVKLGNKMGYGMWTQYQNEANFALKR